MFHRLLVIASLVLFSVTFLQAQPAQSRAQAIAPWVTEDTVWVATARLADVNLDSAGKWINDAAAQVLDPADLPQARQGINQGLALVRGLRDQLQTAGATDVYAIYDVRPQGGESVSIIIPAGASAQAIVDKLAPMVGRQKIAVDQNSAVIRLNGNRSAAKPAAARPDVVAALSKSDAPVVMALTIPQEIRNMIPPQLPQQMGGADLSPIQDGFTWACLDLRFTPDPAVHGVAQMDGANNAKGAMDVIQSVLNGDQGRPAEREAFAKIKQWFLPEVKDDQLVVDLSTDKLNKAVADLGPSIRRARDQAKRIQSASQIRQLLMGVHMFASQNGGKTPDKLDDINPMIGGSLQRMMVNPARPKQNPGYIYVKQPALNIPNVSDIVVIYEAHDSWDDGINVGYLDGHVEWVNDEARFQQELKASGGQPVKK